MSLGTVNTLESKLDKTGGTILGDLTINKNLTIHNTLTINNNIIQTNGTATLGNIDIFPFTNNKPQITFHYNNSQNPTSYIVENEQGYLSLNQSPPQNDSSKKIATTEWVKIYPVPFAYKLVDSSKTPYNVGSDKNPVYFKDGIPIVTGNVLDKDISGNAATATYATNAGYATNSDEATHSTNADLATKATKADKFTNDRTLTFTGVIEGSINNFNINKSNTVNISKSSGAQLSSMIADWGNVKRVSSGYKATEYCYAIVYVDAYSTDGVVVVYGPSGNCMHNACLEGRNNVDGSSTRTIPLQPGCTIYVNGAYGYTITIVGVKK